MHTYSSAPRIEPSLEKAGLSVFLSLLLFRMTQDTLEFGDQLILWEIGVIESKVVVVYL